MKGKLQSSNRFSAEVTRGGGLAGGARPRGFWSWACHGPVQIGDPEQARRILANLSLPQLFTPEMGEGWTWVKNWQRIQQLLGNMLHVESNDARRRLLDQSLEQLSRIFIGGRLQWAEAYENLIVNEGLDDMLDKYFKGSTYTAAHYVGLADGTPTPAAGDTMSSHAGWSEVTAYSESNRQDFTPGTVSSQSVNNSSNKAVFSINGTTTVGGGFLTTNNTKSGTTGTLVAIGAFTGGDKSLGNGDSLSVQADFSQADDGV